MAQDFDFKATPPRQDSVLLPKGGKPEDLVYSYRSGFESNLSALASSPTGDDRRVDKVSNLFAAVDVAKFGSNHHREDT